MHRSFRLSLLVSSLLLALSCSDSVTSSLPPSSDMRSDSDMRQDAGLLDMGRPPLKEDMAYSGDMILCVPKSECETTVCGPVSDGCGGTLECESCVCVAGKVVQGQDPSCGPCGLGVLECEGSADAPEGLCNFAGFEGLVAIDKMQGCEERIVYVDAAVKEGTKGMGTKDAPFGALKQALEEAKEGQIVVVSQAPMTLETPLSVKPGVHVLAGFVRDGERWQYSPEGRTRLQVDSDVPGFGRVGLVAKGVGFRTVWSRVDIVTSDLTQATTDLPLNLGVLVMDSDAFRLEYASIQSGLGAPGVPGRAGAKGSDGRDGQDGISDVDYKHEEDSDSFPLSGTSGGQSTCGVPGGDGGLGAQPLLITNSGVIFRHRVLPLRGNSGTSSVLAAGGKGGEIRTFESDSTGRGQKGQDGQSPEAFASGAAGAGGSTGAFNPETNAFGIAWRIGSALGGQGKNGSAGGGGGGGGGADHARCYSPWGSWAFGATGAGGGSGGCPGGGGAGGFGGGSSIGLAVVDSTLELDAVKVQASLGGAGGAGGLGGGGGKPGEGGKEAVGSTMIPSNFACSVPCKGTSCTISGGGGRGGQGQSGQQGGGGAGGASLGIVCSGNSLLEADKVDILSDGSASGGEGQGNTGRGASGLSAKTQGCD